MEPNLDRYALRKMGYGLYIVSSIMDGKPNAQLANTVFQVTSEPAQIAAAISHSNLTHEYISHSCLFSVSILQESAPFTFIGPFGFRSGRVIGMPPHHRKYRSGCGGESGKSD
jgi:ferric-chelate reductase [NAD(P)H]